MGEEEIISLIPLLLQGKATDEQERAVRCWLEENEAHLEVDRKYCAVYYRLYYAGEWEEDRCIPGNKAGQGTKR